MRLHDSVVLLTAPLSTGYGGRRVRDWTRAARTPSPAHVQPEKGAETADGGTVLVTRAKLFLPAGVLLDPAARVEWRGQTFDVDGPAAVWHRRGRPRHAEVDLVAVHG